MALARNRLRRRRLLGRNEVSDKMLDDASRDVVLARERHRCAMCGLPKPLQWAHARTRRYKRTRWLSQNVMALCAGCHEFKWHIPPAGFDPLAWHRERFPGWLKYVDDLLLYRGPKPRIDRKLILIGLRQELKRVGAQ